MGIGVWDCQYYIRAILLNMHADSLMCADFLQRLLHRNILWELSGKPFDGHPFVIAGRQRLECRYGPQYPKTTAKTKVPVIIFLWMSTLASYFEHIINECNKNNCLLKSCRWILDWNSTGRTCHESTRLVGKTSGQFYPVLPWVIG